MKLIIVALCVLVVALNANFIEEVVSETQLKSVEKYWTKENIASATPMEMPVVDLKSMKLSKLTAKSVEGGNTKPVPTPYRNRPHIYTGKLLFQTARGRCLFFFFLTNYFFLASCTASAVGGNIVITAGHCLWGVRNFFFFF